MSILLDRGLDFRTLTAAEAMVPRVDVDTVRADDSLTRVVELFATGHSRFPVTGADGVDDVIGVIGIADILGVAGRAPRHDDGAFGHDPPDARARRPCRCRRSWSACAPVTGSWPASWTSTAASPA